MFQKKHASVFSVDNFLFHLSLIHLILYLARITGHVHSSHFPYKEMIQTQSSHSTAKRLEVAYCATLKDSGLMLVSEIDVMGSVRSLLLLFLLSLVEVHCQQTFSLSLLHGSDSGQPFLCGPQYSWEQQ